MMISRKFVAAVKLSPMKCYEIAHEAELHTSTLSRIIHGYDDIKPGDERVIRVAKVLGLKPEDCFEGAE
jgi:plasmid maintenance system antidote protein VapI